MHDHGGTGTPTLDGDLPTAAALEWVARWDRQQEVYLPHREERFDAVVDLLEGFVREGDLPADLRVLDLACGPGAIGHRLLSRLPQAHYLGVDVDPVLLHLGRQAGRPLGDRYEVREVDLVDEGWSEGLGTYHVVASSTALHWLPTADLRRVVADSARLLEPGGVFVDADDLAFASPVLQRVASALGVRGRDRARDPRAEDWDAWWSAAREDAVLGPLCAERDVRFPPGVGSSEPQPPQVESYRAALADAGLTGVDTVWQRLEDRVLVALKPAPRDGA